MICEKSVGTLRNWRTNKAKNKKGVTGPEFFKVANKAFYKYEDVIDFQLGRTGYACSVGRIELEFDKNSKNQQTKQK